MSREKKDIQESFCMDVWIGTSDMFWFLMRHNYFSFGGVLGVAISLGCLVYLILTYQTNDTMTNVFLGLIALVFTVIQPWQLLSKAHRQIAKNPIFQEPMHYEISNKTLTIHYKEEKLDIEWANMYKVIETKKRIYLYVDTVHSYIFPKEACGEQLPKLQKVLEQNFATKGS